MKLDLAGWLRTFGIYIDDFCKPLENKKLKMNRNSLK